MFRIVASETINMESKVQKIGERNQIKRFWLFFNQSEKPSVTHKSNTDFKKLPWSRNNAESCFDRHHQNHHK